MTTCFACSMPINAQSDKGAETSDGVACVHCSNADGTLKTCEEIFEGGVQFFLASIPGTDRELAEKLVRKNMNNLPYWQQNKCNCLEGEEASDEEFQAALAKL